MKKRVIALLMATMMLGGALAACGSPADSGSETPADSGNEVVADAADEGDDAPAAQGEVDLSEHVTITIGGIGVSVSDTVEGWPTEIVEYVQDKFNITLVTDSNTTESLNLDLTSGTTADIIQINDPQIEGVLRGQHAVALDPFRDTLASNIFRSQMDFRNDVMTTFKSDDSGQQFFVTPRVAWAETEANYGTVLNNGFIVRWDLYQAIGAPEINSADDYIDALIAMHELEPTTPDGLPTFAMGVYNNAPLHTYFYAGCLIGGFVNLEGGVYVQDAVTNELYANIFDVDNDRETAFWLGVRFYNRLHREGLLDPDFLITQSADLTEKTTRGQFLGGFVNWFYGNYNADRRAEDDETLQEFITLPAYLGWANEKNMAGWVGKYFFVSTHSPNIERSVMLLDWLQSEEGSRIIASGVPGPDRWEEVDGVSQVTESFRELRADGSRLDEWRRASASGFLNNAVGEDYFNVAADGGRIELWAADNLLEANMTFAQRNMAETLGLTVPSDVLRNRVNAGTSIDLGGVQTAIQFALPVIPREIVRIDSNTVDITMSAIPDLVQAATDEEFEAAKAQLLADLEAAGAQQSVDWWMENWGTAKANVEALLD